MKTNLNQWLKALGLALELKQRQTLVETLGNPDSKNNDILEMEERKAVQTLMELEEALEEATDDCEYLITKIELNLEELITIIENEYNKLLVV